MIHELTSRFNQVFGRTPRIVQAPGRVNIIGEHTDYNGFPVLPMAIDRVISVAYSPRTDHEVHLVHAQDEYPVVTFPLGGEIQPHPPGHWSNYARAAISHLYRIKPLSTGLNLMVQGNIPPAAGLSSSSALVVAIGLAYAQSAGLDLSRAQMAEEMARAERYVGTQGGGMDQAISLLGEAGYALRIDFFPLSTQKVLLPQGVSMVVAQSLVLAKKSGLARQAYNQRPLECRLATAVLAHSVNQVLGRNERPLRLAGLLPSLGELASMEQSTPLELAMGILGEEAWSLEAIADHLELSPQDVAATYLQDQPEPPGGYLLGPRVRHVLTEAERVGKAASASALELGELMNQSHASCREDYQISTPELDRLVEIALEEGAYGSRLTGAGFGGCTVSLVPTSLAHEFAQKVYQRYHREYLAQNRPDLTIDLPQADLVFPCQPSDGAKY